MSDRATGLQRRLRTAGYLLIAGLVVEALTLIWAHPTSFLAFLGIGGVLVAVGISLYLITLVSSR